MLIPFLLPLLLSAQDSLSGQLPKRDLGVDAFLAAHPEYDGRTIRVAVLDTGIDPGHPFLQTTPDGRRKIVDWYDATSDGRLSTPVQTKADSQGRVIGLSGRVLDLGNYNLEGRVYSLGRVDAEFLPGSLADRIRGDRHQAWQDGRRSWQEARTRFEADGGAAQDASLRELETTRSWASFRDGGPCFDVVVFESEDGWRVVVDVDEDGDIGEETALRSFRESGDWAVLGDEANLNFCIEVQSPELTMFYFDSNGHGTHVAGIIGAWEGPEGRLNGIAPGVEFVAIKIGDGKYGGATSGFSIAKALDYAVESGCTIANMSFGGPSFFADGQEPDAWVIEEARKRGLITVTSAGNEGPTLTTVGAPATAEAAFSIGAAVWPDTQRSNYSSLAPSGPVMFDFSSRGPLPNGGIGVDFAAPGAALSSLPSWLGTKGENFNGTSMAAPQAAGCIALLQCAAGVEGLPAGPDRIHRALRLGAQRLQGHELVDHGHGAISMLPSLEALRILSKSAHRDQEFEVVVNNPFGKGSGIYLRNPLRHRANQVSISVTPVFADKASNAEKSDFLRTFRVESPSTWVLSPEAVYTSAHGHSFKVRVDATELEPGLHSTAIYLWNAEGSSEQGADVVIPVTVVVPHEVDPTQATDWELEFPLEPGHLKRNFIKVPAGAHTAMIRLKHEGDTQNEYRTGAGSVSGFRYEGDRQRRGRFFLQPGETASQDVPVEAGTVLEYTVASRWATNTSADVSLSIEFFGLEVSATEWVIPAGQDTGFIAVKSMLQDQVASISAKVEGVSIPVLAPMTIAPDPIRATVMDGQGMFYGTMEWEQSIPSDCSVSLRTAHSIQTTEIREDLMLDVFNQHGERIIQKIAYEKETDLGHLDAGVYRFRLTFPSLGKEALEARFAGAEVLLHIGGDALSLYPSLSSAMSEKGGLDGFLVPLGGARSVFARAPQLDPLPAGQSYFGSAEWKHAGHVLAAVPLRVERPMRASLEGPQIAFEMQGEEEAAAWKVVRDAPELDHQLLMETARSWAEAAPEQPEACLALLEAARLVGMEEFVAMESIQFLKRFPGHTEAFRSVLKDATP